MTTEHETGTVTREEIDGYVHYVARIGDDTATLETRLAAECWLEVKREDTATRTHRFTRDPYTGVVGPECANCGSDNRESECVPATWRCPIDGIPWHDHDREEFAHCQDRENRGTE